MTARGIGMMSRDIVLTRVALYTIDLATGEAEVGSKWRIPPWIAC